MNDEDREIVDRCALDLQALLRRWKRRVPLRGRALKRQRHIESALNDLNWASFGERRSR